MFIKMKCEPIIDQLYLQVVELNSRIFTQPNPPLTHEPFLLTSHLNKHYIYIYTYTYKYTLENKYAIIVYRYGEMHHFIQYCALFYAILCTTIYTLLTIVLLSPITLDYPHGPQIVQCTVCDRVCVQLTVL